MVVFWEMGKHRCTNLERDLISIRRVIYFDFVIAYGEKLVL